MRDSVQSLSDFSRLFADGLHWLLLF